MAQYNWHEIREKYETGKYSMPELVEEYGFSLGTGYNHASEENWVKGKNEEKVKNEASKKILDEESGKVAKILKEYMKYTKILRQKAMQGIVEGNIPFQEFKKLKITSEIIKNCKQADYDLYEIGKVADKLELELNGQVTEKYVFDITQRILNDPEQKKTARQLFRRAVNTDMGS